MGKSVAGNAELEEVQETLDVHATDLTNLYSRPYATYYFADPSISNPPAVPLTSVNGNLILAPAKSYGYLPLYQVSYSGSTGLYAQGPSNKTFMFHVTYCTRLAVPQTHAGPWFIALTYNDNANIRTMSTEIVFSTAYAYVAGSGTALMPGTTPPPPNTSTPSSYSRILLDSSATGVTPAQSRVDIYPSPLFSALTITLLNVY